MTKILRRVGQTEEEGYLYLKWLIVQRRVQQGSPPKRKRIYIEDINLVIASSQVNIEVIY